MAVKCKIFVNITQQFIVISILCRYTCVHNFKSCWHKSEKEKYLCQTGSIYVITCERKNMFAKCKTFWTVSYHLMGIFKNKYDYQAVITNVKEQIRLRYVCLCYLKQKYVCLANMAAKVIFVSVTKDFVESASDKVSRY